MSKKTKVLKYKVVNTNIDKKFIGKNLDLERVKAKGGPGGDGGKKPPKPKAPVWFKEFSDNINKKFDRQDKRFDKLEKEVLNLGNRLDTVIKVNNLKE